MEDIYFIRNPINPITPIPIKQILTEVQISSRPGLVIKLINLLQDAMKELTANLILPV
jgi:hypothetical protein